MSTAAEPGWMWKSPPSAFTKSGSPHTLPFLPTCVIASLPPTTLAPSLFQKTQWE